MKWRTEYQVGSPCKRPIGHDDKIVTVGSCFADEIGSRLDAAGWDVLINPFGTLFNPASISMTLRECVDNRFFDPAEAVLTREGDMYVTFSRHSLFKARTPRMLATMVDDANRQTYHAIVDADILILTLGSARCFVRNDTGEVVANCHRYPADRFTVTDLTVEQVVDLLDDAVRCVRSINPGLRVIITVSPVRHVAYGIEADSLSKATLIVAAHRVGGCEYFPAYEILTDDLRDYRFYKSDLTHPTDIAADYVMDCFARTYFTPRLIGQFDGWHKIVSAIRGGTIDRSTLVRRIESMKPSEQTLQRLVALIDNHKLQKPLCDN